MVAASWYGNRAGYKEGRADGAAAQRLAAHERGGDEDGPRAAPANRDDVSDPGDCLRATWPPRPCVTARARAAAPPADAGYRRGSQRTVQSEDPDGPWKTLPLPEISPADRAKLVAELELRDRK